ncbi:MAG: 5-(carboxyamino)imidazole ribonucleotide synthase [Fluviicola sp.]|nr:5-(carboxyamino)imidazole ribonucleotide synthase [Fluviicola sp.]
MLGGGQLGRMFIQEAVNYNISVHILENDFNAPSASLASPFTKGDIQNYDDVLAFGKDMDVLTIEIENVNIEALYELEKQGVTIYPQPRVLEIIKDKGLQKQFYIENDIPTSSFFLFDKNKEQDLATKLPFVQKLRTGGYDGQGVKIIKTEVDLNSLFDGLSIIEELIPFEKELSVIVARNEKGEIVSFQTVECEFNDANLVEFLFSPADISEELESRAIELAKEVIQKLDMVGILAVELFLTKDGKLLVNEVAPRPHNSGHHTIECNVTSQFSQHLRSILGLPLGSTEIIRYGAMVNLLGSENHTGKAIYNGLEEVMEIPSVYIHLYGKDITKPNRKMGHITVTGETLNEAKTKAKSIMNSVKITS